MEALMSRSILHVALLAAVSSGGCTEGMICTTSVEPGVVVEIRDAVDDTPLAGAATGRVRDGGFSDSLRAYGVTATGMLLSRAGADEREGTYVVEVSHPGFAIWEQNDVRVTGDACHVETVLLQARLVRAP
jgi:hypothetical protein